MAVDLRNLFKTPGFGGGNGGSIGDALGTPAFEAPIGPFGPSSGPAWDPGATDDPVIILNAAGAPRPVGASPSVTGLTAPSPTTVSGGTGFSILLNWDSSVAAAPAGFMAAVMKAATYLASQFSDAVTLDLNIGWGEVGGSTLSSGALAQTSSYLQSVSYGTMINALNVDATTASDAGAVATLPATNPNGGNYWTTTAEAKALGLSGGISTDASIGFSSLYGFTFDNSGGVAAGTYDFNGVALHEMSETMGRILLVGASIGSYTNSYMPLDLFHYSAANVRDFSGSTSGYFSIDSGVTNLAAFNTVSGGDPGDWASSVVNDAADAFATPGTVLAFSNVDLTTLDVVGWNRVGQTPPPPPPPNPSTPTGISVADATSWLARAQGSVGLAANVVLATIRQVGGASADSYSFALGGGGSAFSLTTSSNVATLAVGGSGAAGAAGGRLYALTVTPADTTSGHSGPAVPLDVIVGSGGDDSVGIAALSAGVGTVTPTFVYGLAGEDRLDATGMTGKVYFDGGSGADVMTGGSGVNDYLYGATSDSSGVAIDIITNFHAADLIDLTGLGRALSYAGSVTGSLAARSVGWASSGGNTFVYVNTSRYSEALGSTNMKIELLGGGPLSSGNIVHL